jgi:hypothetical protein
MWDWTILGLILRIRRDTFNENSFVTVHYLPYGPDLAPSHFWLFGHIETFLLDRVFDDMNQLLETVIELSDEI